MNTTCMLAASPRPLSVVLVDAVCRNRPSTLARLRGLGADDRYSDGDGELQPMLPLEEETERIERVVPQPFVPPDEVAAAALLGRAFDGNREALRRLMESDAVTIIEVPTADFIDLVTRVLRRHVIDGDAVIKDGDMLTTMETSIAPAGSVVVFTRDGSNKAKLAQAGNAEFACAVQRRFAVIGIATDPERALPRDLVRMAEHRLTLSAVDAEVIATVIEAITGRHPGAIDHELGKRVTLNDLSVAVRADLGPRRSLERLRHLVAVNDTDSTPMLEHMHGLGEAKDWGLNLVRDLRDYMARRIPWSAVDKGCLLIGPPGTGKTTFARSLQKSVGPGVHFIATSYSQWQAHKEGHLGHVTAAIRASFDEAAKEAAKKRSCSIVFIDEVDVIPPRGAGGQHADWWGAILATVLECLDGMERREGVIVIGACNHPRLDPALTRSGRFDKQVRISLPDTPALAGIFRVHLGADLDGVDLLPTAIAARGKAASGADVERWVRASRRFARFAKRPVALEDLLTAIREGSAELPADVRRRIAYHEAAHIISAVALDVAKPVSVSINPSGGLTETTPTDLSAQTRDHIEKFLMCRLAGRAAEQLVYGNVTAGAGGSERSDLSVATQLAIRLETSFGLGELGPVWAGDEPDQRDLLMFADLRRSVRQTLEKAHDAAKEVLARNRSALDRLAEALLARGYLDSSEIDAVLAAAPVSVPIGAPGSCETTVPMVPIVPAVEETSGPEQDMPAADLQAAPCE